MSAPSPGNPPPPPRSDKPPSAGGSLLRHLGRVGREMLSVTLGKWMGESTSPVPGADAQLPAERKPNGEKRVTLLHGVTERLRGAADNYVAAKLDEMEARVDAKLDEIELRIDQKILQFHQQLTEMRDRELRFRLRVLTLTLVVTVLVALLSLGYNWLCKHWI